MQKLTIFFALILCCNVSLGQGTFSGRAASGMGSYRIPQGKSSSMPDYFKTLKKGDMVNWPGEQQVFEVIQVVDEKNAILKARPFNGSGRYLIKLSDDWATKVWYEGPTKSMVDDGSIRDIGQVRFQGTKSYTTVLGATSTISHVKHFTKAQVDDIRKKLLKENPGSVVLTLKSGISAVVQVVSKKGSSYKVKNLENNREIELKLKVLDSDSKKLLRSWKPSAEKNESEIEKEI